MGLGVRVVYARHAGEFGPGGPVRVGAFSGISGIYIRDGPHPAAGFFGFGFVSEIYGSSADGAFASTGHIGPAPIGVGFCFDTPVQFLGPPGMPAGRVLDFFPGDWGGGPPLGRGDRPLSSGECPRPLFWIKLFRLGAGFYPNGLVGGPLGLSGGAGMGLCPLFFIGGAISGPQFAGAGFFKTDFQTPLAASSWSLKGKFQDYASKTFRARSLSSGTHPSISPDRHILRWKSFHGLSEDAGPCGNFLV